jgi:hypothetical protein
MDQLKFEAIMPIIVNDLASRVAQAQGILEKEAVIRLYSSILYAKLEQEKTKVWQFSGEQLLELYLEEQRTGKITFPE